MAKIINPLVGGYKKKSGYTGTTKTPYDLSYGNNLPAYEAPKLPLPVGKGASYGGNYSAGSIGGVTKEGVITGGSSNLERMPTINDGTSGKIDLSYGSNKSFISDRINQTLGTFGSSIRKPSAGGTQNGGSIAPAQDQTQKPSTSPSTPSPSSTPSTTIPSAKEMGVMTYEEYLESQRQSYQDDYEKMLKYYEDQNATETERIKAEKAAAEAEAEKQRQLLLKAAEKAKNTAYTAAEKQLMSDLNYTETQYQALVDAINAEKESGIAMAEGKRQLLLDMSEKQRDTIYAAAEAQREHEYANAEIERERGIVDARSSYAQNKSSYGANAEALASMGLSGSGYGEYMDSAAYAQQRAETQQANAQSEASKRQARYTENQQKLSADQEHAQNQYNAEMQYLQDKYDVDSTYRSNMLTAEQERASGKKTAEDKERQTKYEADQQFESNSYAANSAYSSAMREADQKARDSKAATDKETSTGKLTADLNYGSNIRGLEDKVQEKKQSEKEYARSAYYEILDKANSGSYTEDQIKQLAEDYGLSDEQTKSLVDAANTYAEKHDTTGDANTYKNYMNMKENADSLTDNDIDKAVKSGLITKADGDALKEQRSKAWKEEIQSYIDSGYADAAKDIIERRYSSGEITKDERQEYHHNIWVNACKEVPIDKVDAVLDDLKKDKNAGRISDADYTSLSKYMWSQYGTSKTASQSGYKANEMKPGQKWQTYEFGGTHYWADGKENKDETTKSILNGISTGDKGHAPSIGTVVSYNGKTYAYLDHVVEYGFLNMKSKRVTEWTQIHDNYGNDPYGDSIREEERTSDRQIPKHATTGKEGIDTSYKNNSGGYTQAVDPAGKSADFVTIQEYINNGNYREGDRARWGEAFRHGTLPDGRNVLDVYNSLSDEDKKALKGTTDKPASSGGNSGSSSTRGGGLHSASLRYNTIM